MTGNVNIPAARKRISRIRCLQECISSLRKGKSFPDSLCYIPSELDYQTTTKLTWKILEEPKKNSKVVKEVTATPSSRLVANGEDTCNSDGKWLQILKVKQNSDDEFESFPEGKAWLLLYSSRSTTDETSVAVPVTDDYLGIDKSKKNDFKKSLTQLHDWTTVVEETYSLMLKKHRSHVIPPNREAVERLKHTPPEWTLEHDAALIQLMSQHTPQESESLGSLRGLVESLDVSTYSSLDEGAPSLTDDDSNTYWETDGSQGQHWIRLTMKKGNIVKYLSLTVAFQDDNYLPEHIVVVAGEPNDLKVLKVVSINWKTESPTEIKLLENLTEFYPIITIRIKACKAGGIDTRIRGIKLNCLKEISLGFVKDFFASENLVRFPILQSFSSSVIYNRSLVLQRFICLLDSVIQYLVPAWQYSIDGDSDADNLLTSLENIRQLLPLSKKRLSLIDTLLKGSSSDSGHRKTVYINRHAALEHRTNPAASKDYSNTVFMQLHEGLRPRDRSSSPLSYRWSSSYDQWWECKFISEGIIDQGGGFRDSLSDIAEELCTSDSEAQMALPFFIRAPNQDNADGNMNKDVFVPNPSCTDFLKYEWIGQLMGACFRSKEILILPLAPFIWKRLVGEKCNWSTDFVTVDTAKVHLTDSLGELDRETFHAAPRNWSVNLSDGSPVCLKVDNEGNPKELLYEERQEYADRVREVCSGEFDKQLKALKGGILKVLPEAVLSLLTWQELEVRICGQPEISVDALMKSTYYHHIEEDDLAVKYFWQAVKNFTNEERSRLLRFITGRRRLPVSIFLSFGKSNPMDPLPESSTCCNTLHLPVYSDEKTAEEKLRYAAYNCVSIDTDE